MQASTAVKMTDLIKNLALLVINILEEHIAVLLEPEHQFCPKSSSAVAKDIYYLLVNNDAKEILQGIRFDSTAVNTETKHEFIS